AGRQPAVSRRGLRAARTSNGAVLIRFDEPHHPETYRMESLGRLARGVMHDFNNLLTLISGYAELLITRMGKSTGTVPELEEIRQAAATGNRLTQQLLAFSRGSKPEITRIDLNALLADMQRMLRGIIGENIELEMFCAEDLGSIQADPGQIQQVVMNLFLNARSAMPGGGKITVRTRNRELSAAETRELGALAAGRYIEFECRDTGMGMAAETRARLFEPFFTTGEGGGTGLGLSIVRDIVRATRGGISVESEPGRGASFRICFPRADETAEPAPVPPEPPASAGGTETVLLVEDDESVRKLLKYLLAKRGYRVLEAGDGLEALALFEREPESLDLVLTDVIMPRMGAASWPLACWCTARDWPSCIYRVTPTKR
ncbi:MAG: response regulator, partial [Acidobacteria bacterium]|nr:response regulator [Acidobacteriota bacterium]